MNRKSDTYLFFWGGLVMMALGLFFFSQNVIVSNSFWGGMSMMGIHVNSGLLVVPLILSIVWLFLKPGIGPKVAIAFSIILIIAGIIQSTRFYIKYVTLFDWIIMLALIFGGVGLVAKGIIMKK